ncbi:hypothetical protein VB780_04420 [Leptolyngbya sp. CCNP1308]|uniref:hypothetical protein n=1 Tax=Leptolyngbya sp. CCNP1308 TaxID=3110255 RepID=UPI002B1FC2F3|nr:hypothetical protein [Leptolyngbya sp. CCNP1308]MEA5447801.1 hypothetical protein [Leptolyngbya sp. CCNP1308]
MANLRSEVAMIVSSLQLLTSDATYHDLALRCQEYLHYQQRGWADQRELAEAMLFNLLVEYLVSAGEQRAAAEQFCTDSDHLTELAMRISSTLDPVAA